MDLNHDKRTTAGNGNKFRHARAAGIRAKRLTPNLSHCRNRWIKAPVRGYRPETGLTNEEIKIVEEVTQ